MHVNGNVWSASIWLRLLFNGHSCKLEYVFFRNKPQCRSVIPSPAMHHFQSSSRYCTCKIFGFEWKPGPVGPILCWLLTRSSVRTCRERLKVRVPHSQSMIRQHLVPNSSQIEKWTLIITSPSRYCFLAVGWAGSAPLQAIVTIPAAQLLDCVTLHLKIVREAPTLYFIFQFFVA